ncbi:hypothetical protein HWV62_42158 [Athelia sp. TMB]|nr:hypothetical protein HWV62_42158 [Athelia sp. TMB]
MTYGTHDANTAGSKPRFKPLRYVFGTPVARSKGINCIPLEVWFQIYANACTDGGQTGRSLAQVSRYIRATSQEYRLQSVSLRGHRQAIAFALMLDNTPTRDRKIIDLRVHLDDDEMLLPDIFPAPASMSGCVLGGRRSTIEMLNRQIRNWISHFGKQRRLPIAESSAELPNTLMGFWELREQRHWRNEQNKTEFITAVQHILLHLHPKQPLLSLTVGSNHIVHDLSRLFSAWLSHTPKLKSLKIHYQQPWDHPESIMITDGIHSSPTSLQYLDLTGVYFRWTSYHQEARGYLTKKDQISDIARIAPSLIYLRLNISAVLIEKLPVSNWLPDFQDISEGSASLPTTVKMIFFQYELQENEASGSGLQWYRSCEDSLKSLAVHEPRFKVVDFCDRPLSLEQLVDRVERGG